MFGRMKLVTVSSVFAVCWCCACGDPFEKKQLRVSMPAECVIRFDDVSTKSGSLVFTLTIKDKDVIKKLITVLNKSKRVRNAARWEGFARMELKDNADKVTDELILFVPLGYFKHGEIYYRTDLSELLVIIKNMAVRLTDSLDWVADVTSRAEEKE